MSEAFACDDFTLIDDAEFVVGSVGQYDAGDALRSWRSERTERLTCRTFSELRLRSFEGAVSRFLAAKVRNYGRGCDHWFEGMRAVNVTS
jgi:hypothetical protein